MQKDTAFKNLISEIDLFNFVWSDILALLQFEDIFFSVDDFECAAWTNAADVATVEPAIFIDSFVGSLLVFVVRLEYLIFLYYFQTLIMKLRFTVLYFNHGGI